MIKLDYGGSDLIGEFRRSENGLIKFTAIVTEVKCYIVHLPDVLSSLTVFVTWLDESSLSAELILFAIF